MYNIKENFINTNCEKIDIRNIHFYTKNDLNSNLGIFITETKHEKGGMFYSESEELIDGVYIYKTYYDDLKALRIYKDWFNYKHNPRTQEAKLVTELKKRQPYVKLTEFPTGIVTLEHSVIGQEIPLYEDYKNLIDIVKIKDDKEILKYYYEMIKVLKELNAVDIIYTDCHAKNFLINEKNNDIKLIDFEPDDISLKKDLYSYKKMINILKENINRINKIKNIPLKLDKEDTLENIEETILLKKLK